MSLRCIMRVCVAAAAAVAAFAQTGEFVFKSEVRLVEVYATVFDNKGRYVDGLTRERFQVNENGIPQAITSFETSASQLSCAILLDTTGSMSKALPVVKNAILKLIDQLREGDSVAVYGFSTNVVALQDFTTDKGAAKKAVLRVRAKGRTALFDAISQVARDIARRNGKKIIAVFTDGIDNASVLNAGASMTRAKKIGVPVYTVAQGEALQSPALLKQLREIAQKTGGVSYTIRRSQEVDEVFQDISRELQHTYMLTYKPPVPENMDWRSIQVAVSGLKDYKIRAKEGYVPE